MLRCRVQHCCLRPLQLHFGVSLARRPGMTRLRMSAAKCRILKCLTFVSTCICDVFYCIRLHSVTNSGCLFVLQTDVEDSLMFGHFVGGFKVCGNIVRSSLMVLPRAYYSWSVTDVSELTEDSFSMLYVRALSVSLKSECR